MRPVSFFSESSSFVTAMIPLLFMSLRNEDYLWSIITTVSLLLSTSTTAVVLCIGLWIFFLFQRNGNVKVKIIVTIIIIAFVAAYLTMPIFSDSYQKLLQVTEGGSTMGSRVYASFDVVKSMKGSELLLGSFSYHQPLNYVSANLSNFAYDSFAIKLLNRGYMYLNTFATLMFSYGILGLVLFLNPYFNLFKLKDYGARGYIVVLFIGIFGERYILNAPYYMSLMLVLLYARIMHQYGKTEEEVE